ncbi:hypothetical protein [uncultured Bacteroides sp.]|uniref:hypothetical protein n=1 Tax=uncultured Bacteroides sp. TaxID=162156 RepID=UPI002AAB6A03|nr:hypothetical protein [uncultured Bacteroides sp.]
MKSTQPQATYGNIASYGPKQKVRKLLLLGGKFTAVQLNEIVGFNDARKVISDLRNKEKMNIQDIKLSDGRKLYWLEQDKSQLSLF